MIIFSLLFTKTLSNHIETFQFRQLLNTPFNLCTTATWLFTRFTKWGNKKCIHLYRMHRFDHIWPWPCVWRQINIQNMTKKKNSPISRAIFVCTPYSWFVWLKYAKCSVFERSNFACCVYAWFSNQLQLRGSLVAICTHTQPGMSKRECANEYAQCVCVFVHVSHLISQSNWHITFWKPFNER